MVGFRNQFVASKQVAGPDLSFLTGRVSDMAKQQGANLNSGSSTSSSTAEAVPVRFGQTVKDVKKLSDSESMMKAAGETLSKMKTIAETDLSKKSDADKIAAQVEYSTLQRNLKDYTSKTDLASTSKSEASAAKGKSDVMAEALSAAPGSADAAGKLTAALSFVNEKQTAVTEKIDALYVEGKKLGKSLKAMYSSK